MIQEFTSEELLPLSGIQHFYFCRRQWALIHIEQQWKENVLTVEGKLLHQRADNPFFSEVREGVIIARSMPVSSYRLGLSGVCDIVEFRPDSKGIRLHNRQGAYQPVPVEYKRGREKQDKCDEVQLCAQAVCLEEMLSTCIPVGYFYYGEIRRRIEIEITNDLRELVYKMSQEMHAYYKREYTPRVKTSKRCKSCSLNEICLPALQERTLTASKYIQSQIDGG